MSASNVIHRITNQIDLPNQQGKTVIMQTQNETPGLVTITTYPEGSDRQYYFHMDEGDLDEYITFLQRVKKDLSTQSQNE